MTKSNEKHTAHDVKTTLFGC